MTNVQFKIPNWLDRICTWPVMVYRKRKYGHTFRRIDLGDNLWTIVDADVYYRLGRLKWYLSGNGAKFYAARTVIIGPGRTKMLRTHREIMDPPKGLLVDHKNLNALDNTRENLRLASRSQNQYNRNKVKSRTSSRFMGVCLPKNRKKFDAYIKYGNKRIWLGSFDDEIEAAKAYDEAAKKYHGQFARLNFPQPSEARRAEQLRRITHGKSD